MLLQNFDLEPENPHYELKIKQTLTIKPMDFRIRATLRNGKKPGCLLSTLHEAASVSVNRTKTSSHPNGITSGMAATTGPPMSIFYGSNTGTCEALAYRLASDAAQRGFSPRAVADLNKATKSLPKGEPVVIIAASYDGLPSDNASEFVSWLDELKPKALEGVLFAVFGCGMSLMVWDRLSFCLLTVQAIVTGKAPSTRSLGALTRSSTASAPSVCQTCAPPTPA